MNTEPGAAPTVREPVPSYTGASSDSSASPSGPASPAGPSGLADPLAKVMLTPRQFLAVLAVAGVLLGLLLALLPVRVANASPDQPGYVTCGNTIGGVEVGPLGDQLGRPRQEVLATYVGTCESAVATRVAFSWPLFFVGALAIVWRGVVRRSDQQPLPQ
jgi:hypothetical protein